MTVTVPVEPLIAKKRNVMIQTRNVPPGYNLILFPTKIEVNCLVPMSEYSNELPVTVYADFQSIKPGMSHIPVSVSAPPDITRGITLSADSVEFIIEKR